MRRRRHFAHRSLSDCPLANQSAEVLEAKRQLFDWLETKHPGRVRYDSTVDGCAATTPADVLVETEKNGTYLYWVFDRQQRNRQRFLHVLTCGPVHAHYLHTRAALNLQDESALDLTASQREFMTVSDFDRATHDPNDGHLLFILPDEGKVRIYRGLRCVHAPQRFFWHAVDEAAWSDAKIAPGAGEIVLAPDVERWRAWKIAVEAEQRYMAELAQRRQAAAEAERRYVAEAERRSLETRQRAAPPHWQVSIAADAPPRDDQSGGPVSHVCESSVAEPRFQLAQSLRCEDCGTETTDWSVGTPRAGTCVCRPCNELRWAKRQAPRVPPIQ
jgi:hypothetical protein